MRLSHQTTVKLPPTIQRFHYDREKLKAGIVHLGVGAFHRAHQAVYINDYIEQSGDLSWGIIGASLRNATVSQQLNPQQGLYTVVEKNNTEQQLTLIGCLQHVVVAPECPLQFIQILTDPMIKIVSLTITEKGYYHDPVTGQLQLDHPDIQHDLFEPDNPKTAIGYLVSALKVRYEHNISPFTVMSCDNIPNNGKLLKKLIMTFAELFNPIFAQWIDDKVSFPSTMVDRIVPATSIDDRDRAAKMLTVTDEAMVVAEPFKQWVIEDDFCAGRPAWEKVGVTMVDDVQPFEEMKLRLLNGSHSTLAYLGCLAGYPTIAEMMQQKTFATLVQRLMDEEITPGLELPDNMDVEDYKKILLQRFSNLALQHKTAQVAMDGSQKLPQRLLKPLRYQLQHNGSITLLSLSIAGWIHYCTSIDETGKEIEISDPLADRFKQIAQHAQGNIEHLVAGFLNLREVFDTALSESDRLKKMLVKHLQAFYDEGVLLTVEKILSTHAD